VEKAEPFKQEKSAIISRRRFLKVALAGTAGRLLYPGGAIGSSSVWRTREALEPARAAAEAKALPRKAIVHITRVPADESACASCGLCGLVCAAVHGDAVGPSRTGIWLDRRPFDCESDTIVCRHCDAPECFYACDTEDAFYIDKKTGARAIDSDKCVGCRQCIEACVFDTPRIRWDEERGVAVKCDLCSSRPEGPACVAFCPMQALTVVKEARE
jgi:Fe-S-cluster-containing hydrogenase component 2